MHSIIHFRHIFCRDFEKRALELLEKCSADELEQTKSLVSINIPAWGNKSLIQLAALSNFQEFISHPRCKDISDQDWKGDITTGDGEFLNMKVCIIM
jgi:hypothetical protein